MEIWKSKNKTTKSSLPIMIRKEPQMLLDVFYLIKLPLFFLMDFFVCLDTQFLFYYGTLCMTALICNSNQPLWLINLIFETCKILLGSLLYCKSSANIRFANLKIFSFWKSCYQQAILRKYLKHSLLSSRLISVIQFNGTLILSVL